MVRQIVLAISLCGLAACSAGSAGGPPTVDLSKVVTTAADVCRTGQPILAIVAGIPDPKVSIPAQAVGTLCSALLAGNIPVTFDANTVNWLQENLGGIRKIIGSGISAAAR